MTVSKMNQKPHTINRGKIASSLLNWFNLSTLYPISKVLYVVQIFSFIIDITLHLFMPHETAELGSNKVRI